MKARGGALGLIGVIGVVAIAGFGMSFVSATEQAQIDARRTLVIYPGDYVVQQGDLDANGAWREGVNPSVMVLQPGESAVQASDFNLLGRWRIDVNAATGEVAMEAVDVPDKAIVNPYLVVPSVSCLDCNGNASTTRTIEIAGSYNSSPLTCVWSNPLIGWPSVYPGFVSRNVSSVTPGTFFNNAPPYSNGDPFTADFVVQMTVWGSFGVYVDVLGDLTGAGCPVK